MGPSTPIARPSSIRRFLILLLALALSGCANARPAALVASGPLREGMALNYEVTGALQSTSDYRVEFGKRVHLAFGVGDAIEARLRNGNESHDGFLIRDGGFAHLGAIEIELCHFPPCPVTSTLVIQYGGGSIFGFGHSQRSAAPQGSLIAPGSSHGIVLANLTTEYKAQDNGYRVNVNGNWAIPPSGSEMFQVPLLPFGEFRFVSGSSFASRARVGLHPDSSVVTATLKSVQPGSVDVAWTAPVASGKIVARDGVWPTALDFSPKHFRARPTEFFRFAQQEDAELRTFLQSPAGKHVCGFQLEERARSTGGLLGPLTGGDQDTFRMNFTICASDGRRYDAEVHLRYYSGGNPIEPLDPPEKAFTLVASNLSTRGEVAPPAALGLQLDALVTEARAFFEGQGRLMVLKFGEVAGFGLVQMWILPSEAEKQPNWVGVAYALKHDLTGDRVLVMIAPASLIRAG